MSRLPENGVDVLVAVAEPTLKSIEVAKRVFAIARARHEETIVVLAANKVVDDADRAVLAEHFAEPGVVIPFDRNVAESDRTGEAPLDADSNSPAIVAMSRLADLLDSMVTARAGR